MTTPQNNQNANTPMSALTRQMQELNRQIKQLLGNQRQDKMAAGVNTGQAQSGGAPTSPLGRGAAPPPGTPQNAPGGAMGGIKSLPWGKALIAAEVASLALVIPALLGGSKEAKSGVEDLNTSLGGLNKSAMDASSAISRLVIELRAVTAEAGITAQNLVGLTAAYSAIGAENPMDGAAGFARHYGQLRRGFAMGQPSQGYLLGAGLLGMNPLDIQDLDPVSYQRKIIEQLRGMSAQQRGSDRTRGALEAMYGPAEMANLMRMAELPNNQWNRFTRNQDAMQARMGEYMPGLTRRSQALLGIQSQRQMEQAEFRLQREYMRTGGGGEPVLAELKAEVSREWESAQRVFWKTMMPILEQVRDLFKDLGKPGGAIETFGKVMRLLAADLAGTLGVLIGAFTLLAAAIKLLVDVIRTAWKVSSAVSKGLSGNFVGAWNELKSIPGMYESTAALAGSGVGIMATGLSQGMHAKQDIHNNVGDPTYRDIERWRGDSARRQMEIDQSIAERGLMSTQTLRLIANDQLSSFFSASVEDSDQQGRNPVIPTRPSPSGQPAP